MRAEFCKLIPSLDPVPLENVLGGDTGPGTPDVELIGAYCELKYDRKWPVRASTIVRIPHYTQEQRAWLLRRWNAGEPTYLVYQVNGVEWLIWKAPEAQAVGTLTRQQMYDTCYRRFTKKPTVDEMTEVFRFKF